MLVMLLITLSVVYAQTTEDPVEDGVSLTGFELAYDADGNLLGTIWDLFSCEPDSQSQGFPHPDIVVDLGPGGYIDLGSQPGGGPYQTCDCGSNDDICTNAGCSMEIRFMPSGFPYFGSCQGYCEVEQPRPEDMSPPETETETGSGNGPLNTDTSPSAYEQQLAIWEANEQTCEAQPCVTKALNEAP